MNMLASFSLLAQNFGYWGGGVFGLIALILYVAAIISIITSGGTIGHKVLWLIIVLLLPVIGAILYFLIGRGAARV